MTDAIAVVVPVFNRAATIEATLNSVSAQTLRPDRLIVVDDGSTDSTAQRVTKWLEVNSGRITGRMLSQPNRGVAAARNRGLAAVLSTSLIAFLDSDDRWPSDFLERAAVALAACPRAVAATANREFRFDEHRSPEIHDLSPLATAPVKWMLANGAGIASATLFRTAAVVRRGGFKESLLTGEDSALFLRLALDGTWLHLPGQPVLFERSLTHRGDVEGHLSQKFPDQFRTWAGVYDDFILRGGGKRVLRIAEIRQTLGPAWYAAGRELMASCRPVEARRCFLKSLRWQPANLKTWKWLARSCRRSKFGSRVPATDVRAAAV